MYIYHDFYRNIYSQLIRPQEPENTHIGCIPEVPSEILVLIFQHLQEVKDDGQDKLCHYTDRGWLSVLGVCRAWRELALDSPRLWSRVWLRQNDLREEWIKRSKSVPLDFFVDIYNVESAVVESLAMIVKGEKARVRELIVSSNWDEEMMSFIRLSECTAAPKLQYLSLEDGHATIPSDTMVGFNWDLPSLRSFQLQGLPLPFPFPSFSNLTELVILTWGFKTFGQCIRLSSAISILRHHPQLEHLELSHLDHFDDDGATSPSNLSDVRVSLPRLKLLELFARDTRHLSLLQHLEYPPTARVILGCSNTHTNASGKPVIDLSLIVSAWTKQMSLGQRDPRFLLTKAIATANYRMFTIDFVTDTDPNTPVLSLCHPCPIEPFIDAIGCFSSTITSLILKNITNVERSTPFFRALHGVQTLVLDDDSNPIILDALLPLPLTSTPSQIDTPKDRDLWYLPKLMEVHFVDITLYTACGICLDQFKFIQFRPLKSIVFTEFHPPEMREEISGKSISPVVWKVVEEGQVRWVVM
ncbi:hypothetical protein ONZ45_g9140 [Pleurotus djamor]|nr:hypothetical protein ONZ45_g9140 [Pleurotus djamor]